jgi:peroxiredoxin
MVDASATLKVGDQAPGFSLAAANRSESFTLAQARAPVIVEFLRGTW